MTKITFANGRAGGTPINATDLNQLQTNVENDIGILSNLETTTKTNLVSAVNEVVCLTGVSAPTTATEGAVGQFYLNTTDNSLYQCVSISNSTYTWEALSSQEIYSTTETKIGTWTDGTNTYDVYRKVITGITLPNNTTSTITTGISNLNKLLKLNASWWDTIDTKWYYNYRIDSDSTKIEFQMDGSHNVSIKGIGANWTSRTRELTITLEYTKSNS